MKKIFVNGTFDILHDGHLQLLNYAKSLGDSLSVGIDSDERVKLLKGESRPINNQQERANMLINLKAVDHVYIFDTDEELKHLVSIHDTMVKGADYKDKPVIGSDVCKELIFFDIIDGYSTTKKIQDITTR
jgi:D-beta-D-heptose 7-phosphate kinase / D-beta-D-heptose 1-phosphate adenosyltransferase